MLTRSKNSRSIFAYGGIAASLILVVFGVASIIIGYQGREDVRQMLADEQITVSADAENYAGEPVNTGAKAQAQADVIRKHQLESSGGLTYAQMGRFATPDGNPAGTNNAEEAAKNEAGAPVANAVRNQWVTATALSTSLNTAYFAEQVGLFSMVMGFALLLTGIGFAVLTLGALWVHKEDVASDPAAAKAGQTTTAGV